MPNLTPILNEIIRRVSRREVRANTQSTRRATAQYRRAIAALKRQVADLTKRLAWVEKRQPRELVAAPEAVAKGRFRAMGVKAHRAKLGLSAKEYGKLVGVSELTIYHWESGKAKPRSKQTVAQWLSVRGMGKREALERLGVTAPKAGAGAAAKPPRATGRRGKFRQTGEELILSLLQGRRALTTAQLGEAWAKAGRGGAVDNVLSRMFKAKALKREPLKGERGSRYRAA